MTLNHSKRFHRITRTFGYAGSTMLVGSFAGGPEPSAKGHRMVVAQLL